MRARRGMAARYNKAINFVKKKVRVPFFFSPHDFLDRTYEFYKKAGFRRELVTSEQGLQGVLDFLSESIPEVKTAKPSQFFDDRFVRAVNAAK